MIRFIKGKVAFLEESSIILDCNQIGFQISMPSSHIFRLTEGMEVVIHTYLSVREDDMSLYGFLTREDLEMFRQLITVSGIGPKGALGILSNSSVEELKFAIASGDAKKISGTKGIGLKTAQKLIVELKGKFKNQVPLQAPGSSVVNSNIETAVLFAEATGISRSQCMKALERADLSESDDVDAILDQIFRNLNIG